MKNSLNPRKALLASLVEMNARALNSHPVDGDLPGHLVDVRDALDRFDHDRPVMPLPKMPDFAVPKGSMPFVPLSHS